MSPRRKIQSDEQPLLVARTGTRPRQLALRLRERLRPQALALRLRAAARSRRWAWPLATMVSAVVMVGAISACALMLFSHESHRRTATKEAAVLTYVNSFMTQFTSVDPFHANDYVDRVLAEATGDFAKQYQDKENEILIQVAKQEPTRGTVLDAGVERWTDDGGADVLVAVDVTSKSPDGKQTFENATRWMATAKQEGNQWKISNLTQVI
ncbi:mammalian cell entry protein [Mycobacterium noviomagense]|uniref:Mammalian cell entry protein n=1 Tax=Mycobacterium noviomagense TaxID=459858 RepID=A0A7I7PD79_9MYCO|nr:mammalian cell entry protein [Mycobacterium noviomagense]ORB11925.1 mammalian cell entry protein [Mycobacterium noviomagense]BBY06571.1 Mce associated protein [Mycobacterium noviomagense]